MLLLKWPNSTNPTLLLEGAMFIVVINLVHTSV